MRDADRCVPSACLWELLRALREHTCVLNMCLMCAWHVLNVFLVSAGLLVCTAWLCHTWLHLLLHCVCLTCAWRVLGMSLACAWHALCLPRVLGEPGGAWHVLSMCLACAQCMLGMYLACLQVLIMASSCLHVLSMY